MNINLKFNKSKIDVVIEYLFYLLVLLSFTGKVFKAISFIIDVLFILQFLLNKEVFKQYFQKYKKLITAFALFISYLLFQSLFLELKYYTLKSSFETIIYIILIFAALYNFNSKEKIEKLIYSAYIILGLLALDSFYQYFNGTDIFGKEMYQNGTRLTAWFDAPKVNLMMGQFFGLLIASIFIFDGNKKKLAIFMLTISLILFILAGNRSPILALFSSIFLIAIFSKYRKFIFVLFLLIGIIFSLSLLNPKLKNSYSSFLNLTNSSATSGRYEIYSVGMDIFDENKWFGIGSHNFKYVFRVYFDKADKSDFKDNYTRKWTEVTPTHVHSVGVDILISYGILGIILFLYCMYNIYNIFIKNNQIVLLSSVGLLYCITPLQFGRSFTMGDWQFITYLSVVFTIVIYKFINLQKEEVY